MLHLRGTLTTTASCQIIVRHDATMAPHVTDLHHNLAQEESCQPEKREGKSGNPVPLGIIQGSREI